jgi:two-component system, chemotaxis family, response regulator Rcp1
VTCAATGWRGGELPHKIQIALVEDNPGDARLFREICVDGARADVVDLPDGEQALQYLFRKGRFSNAAHPNLIVLDLNLPKVSGHEILKSIKADEELREIPVIVFSTSAAASDISKSYDLHASCYLRKPGDLEGYENLCGRLRRFWLEVALLPDVN